ncbi:MAG: hypothetical protein QOF19_2852 [Alphaproteobacteria bacterium]|jgi:hypothetical protein|nr:hypothetical protein [Alphaproteobacteria bacterium]
MKIFISWSGEKAHRVAIALKGFLQDVNQNLIPWFSDADISAGGRWELELATQLETTDYGIVCVTQESLQNPWPMFEAGALSKSVKGSRVCPYLIDLTRSQLDGPLSQFQSKEANSKQTWEMLQSINLNVPSGALPEARLKKYFDVFWPTLEGEIRAANRDLQPLPQLLQRRLLDLLPMIYYRAEELEMLALRSDLPTWEINRNQAPIHVWRELIQVAARHRKLEEFMQALVDEYPKNPHVLELGAEINNWSRSLKSDT